MTNHRDVPEQVTVWGESRPKLVASAKDRLRKIRELRKAHKEGRIKLTRTNLRRGGFKWVSDEALDKLHASIKPLEKQVINPSNTINNV